MYKHLLSVSFPNESLAEFFERILEFYCTTGKEKKPVGPIVDTTCGRMKMWSESAKEKFHPITIDICKDVSPEIVGDFRNVGKYVSKAKVLIFDPPYIDLGKKRDTKGEDWYRYEVVPGYYEHLFQYKDANIVFSQALDDYGLLICKWTDFYYKGKFVSIVDVAKHFTRFVLWDILVYRFFKSIPNLNFYKKRTPRTHSYFLIFKKLAFGKPTWFRGA